MSMFPDVATLRAKREREKRARVKLRALIVQNPDWYHSPVAETLATTDGILVTFSNGERFTVSVRYDQK